MSPKELAKLEPGERLGLILCLPLVFSLKALEVSVGIGMVINPEIMKKTLLELGLPEEALNSVSFQDTKESDGLREFLTGGSS